jgi:outer membrane protein OmpA-like peptidoglycan-associated protein
MLKQFGTAALIALLSVSLSCSTSTGTGTLAGAGGGGVLGAGIGALAGGKKGAIIGAALGGVAGGVSGALIGRYMDKQKEKLDRDLKGGHVEKVGDKLVVKFDNGILFDTDKADLKQDAQTDLTEFARVLNEYPDTNVEIEGHTDSTGSAQHNLKLSQARADAVKNYLLSAQVKPNRLTSVGMGEAKTGNETAEGRANNRRVEIHITANAELKKADAENANNKS